jgi:hypothetical protein
MKTDRLNFFFLTLIGAALVAMLGGCASAPREMGRMAAPAALKEFDAQRVPRLITYTGYIAIEVTSLTDIQSQVAAIVAEAKGYIAGSRAEKSEYTATLRVPAPDLETVMNKVAGLGSLVRRNVNTEDVTDRHIDYEAKLKNFEVLRNQLRELLAKAKTVKETLDVEQELSRVQGEIDSLQGQLTALNNRITFSTLEVRVTPKRIYGPVGYVFRGVWWAVEKLFVIR